LAITLAVGGVGACDAKPKADGPASADTKPKADAPRSLDVPPSPDARPVSAWISFGPGEGGGVVADVFSKTVSGRAWSLTDCDGVHRTDDGAVSWRPVSGSATGGTLVKIGGAGDNVDLAVHPADESKIFVSDGRGKLYRTTDGGSSWSRVLDASGPGDTFGLSAIAFDPANAKVVYVGTGQAWDKRGLMRPSGVAAPGHLYKSLDGGDTWTTLANVFAAGEVVYSLLVDPADSSLIWASTDDGVYRSPNGGASFSPRMSGLPAGAWIGRLRLDPTSPAASRRLLVAIVNPGAVYRSDDGGASWKAKTVGLHPNAGESARSHFYDLEVDPTNASLLYVTDTQNQGATEKVGRVYKSGNAGDLWTELFKTAWDAGGVVDDGWAGDQSFRPGNLAISASSSLLLLHVDSPSRHLLSSDGGQTWSQRYSVTSGVAPDKANQGRGREVIGNSRVVLRDMRNSSFFYVAYGDHGGFYSEDGGLSFRQLPRSDSGGAVDLHDTAALALDPTDTTMSVIYAGTGPTLPTTKAAIVKYTINRATHKVTAVVVGGGLNNANGLPSGHIFDIVVQSSSSIWVRSSAGARIYRYYGSTWAADGLTGVTVNKLVGNPVGGGRLYAATSAGTSSGGVYSRAMSGGAWSLLGGAGAPTTSAFVAVPPAASPLLYSIDGSQARVDRHDGTSWTRVLPDPPAALDAVKVDAGNPAVLVGYKANDHIYRLFGGSWTKITLNLPSPFMKEVHADQLLPSTYYIGEKCLGFWKLSL
jgi:photosystem II stability/assembly factor-like uncharacterized protein